MTRDYAVLVYQYPSLEALKEARKEGRKVRKVRWRVDIQWDDKSTGQRMRKRLSYKAKAAAERVAADTRKLLADTGSPSPEKKAPPAPAFTYTVGHACHDYYRNAVNSEDNAPEGLKKMLEQVKMVERFQLWELGAERVTLDDFDRYREARKAEAATRKKGPKTVGNKTLGKEIGLIASSLALAKRRGRIKVHVFELLDKKERRNYIPSWSAKQTVGKPIPAEVFEKILSHMRPHHHAPARLMLETGMRKGQVCRLDWEKHIPPVPGNTIFPVVQKKGDQRRVPITPRIAELLGTRPVEGGPVFPKSSYWTFTTAWNRARNKVMEANPGTHKFRIHDTRHTHGTELRKDHSTEDTARLLGVTPATAAVYADHANDDWTRTEYEQLHAEEA